MLAFPHTACPGPLCAQPYLMCAQVRRCAVLWTFFGLGGTAASLLASARVRTSGCDLLLPFAALLRGALGKRVPTRPRALIQGGEELRGSLDARGRVLDEVIVQDCQWRAIACEFSR
eukprot:scaffold93922_cov75-Phaeocystis_antarctica.AAC.2